MLERFRSAASCQCFLYHSFKLSSLKSMNAGATNQKKKIEQLLVATIAIEGAKPAMVLVPALAPVGLAALNSMAD